MRVVQRWWLEAERLHIYLRRGEPPSEPAWRLVVADADTEPREVDYASERDARAAARSVIDGRPGHWQSYPLQPL